MRPSPKSNRPAPESLLNQTFHRLIEPAPSITEIEQRYQARLLAAMLVVFIPIAFTSIVIQLFAVDGFESIFPVLLGSLIILFVAYFLSRTRHHRIGAVIAISAPTVAVFVNVVVDPANTETLFFVIVSVLLSSVLFSWRGTAAVAVVTLSMMALLVPIVPSLTFAAVVTPLGFSAMTSGLILVFMRYRDQLKTSQQAELELSEARWRMMMDQSPFSTVIYAPNGSPLRFNAAAVELWQLAEVDLDFFMSRYNILADEQLEANGTLAYIKQAFAGAATVTPANRYQFQRLADDGSTATDNRWLTAYCYPVIGDDGTLIEVVIMHADFTDRKLVEEALRRSEIYYRSLIDNAIDIVTVLNMDGSIRYASPAVQRMLGYTQDDLLGASVFEFVHPDDVTRVREVFEENMLLSGPAPTLELSFRHKDGSWRVLEVFSNNMIDEPVVAGVIINARDVSERKQTEALIRQQDRLAAVGRMAAGIAHDFNNVMAVITLYSQLLAKSSNLTAAEQQKLQTIRLQADRAAELTGRILDFSRQSVMERQPVALLPFLTEFATVLERMMPENINIDLSADGATPFLINADLTRIQQAIMNLALNAHDAMPDGGDINIALAQFQVQPFAQAPLPEMAAGEWVKVTVSDNGIGMADNILQHIFEPFFTTKGPGEGTGLGLAQVYGIVKQHDGHIEVESRESLGTTFTIYIPAYSLPEPESARPAEGEMVSGDGELILVVEDEPTTRGAIADSLEDLNYRVALAANGEEALEIIAQKRAEIRLVLSDVVMPKMGGMALLRALNDMEGAPPVIMLTGHPLGEELEKLRDQGLRDWLQKPTTLEQLAEVVARHLDRN